MKDKTMYSTHMTPILIGMMILVLYLALREYRSNKRRLEHLHRWNTQPNIHIRWPKVGDVWKPIDGGLDYFIHHYVESNCYTVNVVRGNSFDCDFTQEEWCDFACSEKLVLQSRLETPSWLKEDKTDLGKKFSNPHHTVGIVNSGTATVMGNNVPAVLVHNLYGQNIVWGMFSTERGKFKGKLANNSNTEDVVYVTSS